MDAGNYEAEHIIAGAPRPTGYLNVFEYDLAENAIEVYPGDQVHITWFWLVPSVHNVIRFSLAYFPTNGEQNGVSPDTPWCLLL